MNVQPQEESPRIRLSRIIQKLYERLPLRDRSWPKLAERIAAMNPNGIKADTLRKKLPELANGITVPLSVDELDTLNQFLVQEVGFGIGAIFPSPTLLEAVVAKGKVHFLLGAKHRPGRTDISLSDFRCMEWLRRGINQQSPSTQTDFLDIPLPIHNYNTAHPLGDAATPDRNWQDMLNDPNSPSLICLGSQRACSATEILLGHMFGVHPYAPSPQTLSRIPFVFVWSPSQPDERRSSFSACPSAIGHHDWIVNPKDWRTWGIHLCQSSAANDSNTTTFKVHHAGNTARSYGVIVAQRRQHGQVWLVLAGLSGPETLAGARVIDSIIRALPESNGIAPGPVLWVLYEATVEESRHQEIGDNRRLLSQKPILQDYWPPETMRSQGI